MFVPTKFRADNVTPEVRDQLIEWLKVYFPTTKDYSWRDVSEVETLDEKHTMVTYFLKDEKGNRYKVGDNVAAKKRIMITHSKPLTIYV